MLDTRHKLWAGLEIVALANQPTLDPEGDLKRRVVSTQLFPVIRAIQHLQNVTAIQLLNGSFVGQDGNQITPTQDYPITSVSIQTLQAFAEGAIHEVNAITPTIYPTKIEG
ncbi:hypothetical protein KBC75_02895 [Candidatus Shapirobacteria bacterium]|nr:hypothetical protein [Candidatus Shapirobacteria bacterium]